jgi:hypothetical protein
VDRPTFPAQVEYKTPPAVRSSKFTPIPTYVPTDLVGTLWLLCRTAKGRDQSGQDRSGQDYSSQNRSSSYRSGQHCR